MKNLLLLRSFLAACLWVTLGHAALDPSNMHVTSVTRHNSGDLFTATGVGVTAEDSCSSDTCVGLSSGTADLSPSSTKSKSSDSSSNTCSCRCLEHLPVYRDDLKICVDDIHECALAPFVSSSTSQQIPFVFLPLKGQIVHPSKEISFAGVQTPVCAISGAQFLTETGWIDLRSPIDSDVPFKLFRDEGRTFLQWLGDSELRTRMSGRLILVQMLCKDLAKDPTGTDLRSIFTPCVAFRVAGSPVKYASNVSEVLFSPDAQSSPSTGLSVTEYIAIGICSILLGLIYVASVFLYLHLRARRRNKEASGSTQNKDDRRDLTDQNLEEGVIKSNPLLGLRHFGAENGYSDEGSSAEDGEIGEDSRKKNNAQTISAIIHPMNENFSCLLADSMYQDSASIEKCPEENVSIVETLEGREDRPETIRTIVNANARRKLYFNPSYFEPHLLVAPPPAALEFLTKIREVISIAKQKMAAKRFTPSLMGIPEEETIIEPYDFSAGIGSRRSSVISLKRENPRRKSCTGCPGCEPLDLRYSESKFDFNFGGCENCHPTSVSESKQQSIRKWLEDVPILKHEQQQENDASSALMRSLQSLPVPEEPRSPRRLRSPTRSYYSTRSLCEDRPESPDYLRKSNSLYGSTRNVLVSPKKGRPKSKAPAPPKNTPKVIAGLKKGEDKIKPTLANHYDIIRNIQPSRKALPPPDMINEAIEIENKKEETGLQENKISNRLRKFEYEADSLEKSRKNGYSTPTEYGDIPSSQPSPSLSNALPLEEELTMRNEIFNKNTGSKTISKISQPDEDHDYELIVLNKTPRKKENAIKLPELLRETNGYSLVTEVYVNNGYNFGSNPSSRSNSNASTLEKPKPKIHYPENEQPGHLTIELEDPPENYVRVYDSDQFEPDTLDRPSKLKFQTIEDSSEFIDSLERPGKKSLLLKTTGTFKSGTVNCLPTLQQVLTSNFNRSFGSLREIYEAKTNNKSCRPSLDNLQISFENEVNSGKYNWKNRNSDSGTESEEGKLLTLEERQKKRQRVGTGTIKPVPPDIIPPSNLDVPIYEHPKPPRKVSGDSKPPLPPKNGSSRSSTPKSTSPINKESSSPLSSISFDLPSSFTSVDSKTSDFEQFQTKFEENEIDNLQDLKCDSILKEFIHAEDVVFKNGINNQLILQAATITTNSPFNNFILNLEHADSNKTSDLKAPLESIRSADSSRPSESIRPADSKRSTDLNRLLDSNRSSDFLRSADSNRSNSNGMSKGFPKPSPPRRPWKKILDISNPSYLKPEDSGYLSTDSNDSRKKNQDKESDVSDESLGDGHSESGAESVETHSVFFNSFRKFSNIGSMDSGVSQLLEEVGSDRGSTLESRSSKIKSQR